MDCPQGMSYLEREMERERKDGLDQLTQWTLLNGITLGQPIIDPINQMIKILKYISYTNYSIEIDVWDLFNLGQFGCIDKMILSSLIPFSGTHCIRLDLSYVFVILKISGSAGCNSLGHIKSIFMSNCKHFYLLQFLNNAVR
jgi:hypothetical protein